MFGFASSPYIVIVMLAAAGVLLPLLFWFTTQLLNLTSGKRVLAVATTAAALLLLLSSSGPHLKVFSQDPEPPVVGAWTFETVIDPNPLETGSDAGSTVTFRAIFTVDQDHDKTLTALSATITGVQKAVQADLGSNTDNGRIGIGANIDTTTLIASGGASFGDDPCESDLTAGTVTCELMVLGSSKLFARSSATPGTYDMETNFPREVTFTATVSSAGNSDYIKDAKKSGSPDPTLTQQLEVIPGPPSTPVGLSATTGDSQVALDWDDPMDSSIIKYQISQDGGSWTDIPTSAPGETNTTSYTVSGLINSVNYSFAIRAVDSVGRSPISAEVSQTPEAATVGTANFKPSDTLYALNGPTEVSWGETVTYVNKVGAPTTSFAVQMASGKKIAEKGADCADCIAFLSEDSSSTDQKVFSQSAVQDWAGYHYTSYISGDERLKVTVPPGNSADIGSTFDVGFASRTSWKWETAPTEGPSHFTVTIKGSPPAMPANPSAAARAKTAGKLGQWTGLISPPAPTATPTQPPTR